MATELKQNEDMVITQKQYKFSKRDIALIVNIQSKQHWNGNLCVIQSYKKSKQRYHVTFFTKSNERQSGLLKPSNLCVVYPSENYPKTVNCMLCDKKTKLLHALDCASCKSVFYCSSKCQQKHMIKHPFCCENYKRFALKEHAITNEMIDLFKFDNSAKLGLHIWLQTIGLHNKGIWNRLCGCNRAPFGELKITNDSFWGFTKSNKQWIPSFESQINSEFIISDWRQYYKLKQLSLESPIAHFMSYIMSIYYALTKYLKIRPMINSDENKTITIHLIGVEIEVDILILFKELLCLLPGYNFEFYCFGNTSNGHFFRPIGDSMHNFDAKFMINNNYIKFKLFQANYSEKNINDMIECQDKRIPDLAVGLNAGFEAYQRAWFDAVGFLLKHQIPAFFTEYTNASIINANVFMMHQFQAQLDIKHIVNPFRSPLITYSSGARFVSIKNCFIYGFNLE